MRTSEQPFCTMLLWGGDCTDENEEFFWNALQCANWPADALVAADDRAASSASASSSSHHRHHQHWNWFQHHHSHHHYLLCHQLHHMLLLRFIFHDIVLVTIRRRALHLDLTVSLLTQRHQQSCDWWGPRIVCLLPCWPNIVPPIDTVWASLATLMAF